MNTSSVTETKAPPFNGQIIIDRVSNGYIVRPFDSLQQVTARDEVAVFATFDTLAEFLRVFFKVAR